MTITRRDGKQASKLNQEDEMKWTKEPPRKVGKYWWRHESFKRDSVMYMILDVQEDMDRPGVFFQTEYDSAETDDCATVDELGGEWAGPIPLPDEDRPSQVSHLQMRALLASMRVDDELKKMSNHEIALLLIDHIWSNEVLGSPREMLLSEVISRLAPELNN